MIDKYKTNWMFGIFLCSHLFIWTLVPFLVRFNLPLDSIEGAIWGHQLEWGYDKNPFLNAWLTSIATQLSNHGEWSIYLFSQLSVIIALWAVWQIAKRALPPVYALLSVLLLEGLQYFNLHAIDFNDNTLELGLWALTAYAFYVATHDKKISAWIFTGIFAGLSMMAKYYTFALLAGMGLFLLTSKTRRQHFKSLPLYVCILLFCVIIMPHVLWLFKNDFITVRYMFDRAGHQNSLYYHFFFPMQFIWQQLQVFIPGVILFAVAFIGRRPTFNDQIHILRAFDRDFLFYVGLAPFFMTAILSLLLGIKLRAGWGMPLLSLWGIILVANIQPRMSLPKLHYYFMMILCFMALLAGGYSVSLLNAENASSANYPGKEIAATITSAWQQQFGTKLSYVAGSRWLAGNISFYSKDHPAVFIEWQPRLAPWIDNKKLKEQGAVFVWDLTNHEKIPLPVMQAYPQLQMATIKAFKWHGASQKEPVKIGVIMLPPS